MSKNGFIYVTGHRGRLGSVLMELGCSALEIDVTDPIVTSRTIKQLKGGDLIVHLASKSDVDWCEKEENKDQLSAVNLMGAYNVLNAAQDANIPVVLLSSNHVFSGRRWWGKYKESSKQSSINAYGFSKHTMEALAVSFPNSKIVRSSYLATYDRVARTYFAKEDNPKFPTFFKRNFTYINHFAEMLLAYCHRYDEMPKMLHLASSDSMSWYEYMKCFISAHATTYDVFPDKKYENDGFTPRPKNAVLNVSLSAELGLPQYTIRQGIYTMCSDYVAERLL